ncbi:MAG: class I SAM-dependent methyltransferase [Pedosphaera sp.]|nr:class I SAM-dependent methyltransferase [Pedosphaera sp.]
MEPSCGICKSGNIERVPYDNHERKLNLYVVKHHVGAWLAGAGLGTGWLKQRLLFTPSKNILHCLACGYGRYERTFEEGELECYYRRRYSLAGGLPKEAWDDFDYVVGHAKTQGQWAFVSRHLPVSGGFKMLDIGAAASRMSRLAKDHFGGRVECSVIEPGDGWLEYYRHHGIELAGRFFPSDLGGEYDYVHTSHWLEHVEHLEPVLHALRKSTAAGGLCFIEVPNCDATYFSRSFPDSPHIHFFTSASLTAAMRQHGFEAVQVTECAMVNSEYHGYRCRTALLTAEEQRTAEILEASVEQVRGGNLLRALFRAIA